MSLYRRISKRLITAVGFGILLASSALAEIYSIDKSHSAVIFNVRHLVSRTNGRFNDFAGTIQYDPRAPEKARVSATIQVASIDTDNEKRDGHLKSEDFFDATQFPTITFTSTKVEKKGDLLLITGDLTMHGVKKSIVLPVEILGMGTHPSPRMKGAPVVGFASELAIKRSDYGVNTWTDAAGVVGDEVKIQLTIEALGKGSQK